MSCKPATKNSPRTSVGVAGTGFIAQGLTALLQSSPDLNASRVLTRRPAAEVKGVDAALITNSIAELVDQSDLVVECSGDVVHGAEVVHAAFDAGKPVVTMASEFHVTVGSYFADKGVISEAEGDQPGSLAALYEEAVEMGFEPVVLGNFKGFLNHDPTRDEMEHWSRRNGISLAQVTSFTDGTKIQIEQALVANAFGAGIAQRGMMGPQDEPLDVAAGILARKAKTMGAPISDYLLNRTMPPGVFIVAEHPFAKPEVLRYLKLGDGPFYTLVRPYHLCHLEIPRTIRRVLSGRGVLLNNSATPTVNVAAVSKRDFKPGAKIVNAIGGFELRGEAVNFAEEPDAVPIGLLKDARITHRIERGQTIRWQDVEIADSRALQAARHIHQEILARLDISDVAQGGKL
jgi:predicted homoserine dehydrogenase-like protein